jgi:hypothetical protein
MFSLLTRDREPGYVAGGEPAEAVPALAGCPGQAGREGAGVDGGTGRLA